MKKVRVMIKSNVYLSAIITMLFLSPAFAHEWMAPKQAAERKNPVEVTPEVLSYGKELFLDKCAACHGENGNGLSTKDTGLAKDTPNLNKRLLTHSDGDFFWKINNGKGDMPGFQNDLSGEDIWSIIHFIRSSQ